jgi:hypothetical protein
MLEHVLVSLIFPVENDGNYVLTTLESASQVNTQYPFEITVVDDGLRWTGLSAPTSPA